VVIHQNQKFRPLLETRSAPRFAPTPLQSIPSNPIFSNLNDAGAPDRPSNTRFTVNPLNHRTDSVHSKAQRRRKELMYSAMGYQMVLLLLLFTGLGYWADQKMGWTPVGLITGLVLGSMAAVWNVLSMEAEERKSSSENKSEEHRTEP
jgi:F0F1-type ATP synthase assembly protein I